MSSLKYTFNSSAHTALNGLLRLLIRWRRIGALFCRLRFSFPRNFADVHLRRGLETVRRMPRWRVIFKSRDIILFAVEEQRPRMTLLRGLGSVNDTGPRRSDQSLLWWRLHHVVHLDPGITEFLSTGTIGSSCCSLFPCHHEQRYQ